MLKIIRKILKQWIDDIDTGNSNISEEDQKDILDLVNRINSKDLSKTESANYIGVSRATFDNYVNESLIPRGKKRSGWKELSWKKYDLDKYLLNKTNNKK